MVALFFFFYRPHAFERVKRKERKGKHWINQKHYPVGLTVWGFLFHTPHYFTSLSGQTKNSQFHKAHIQSVLSSV